ncbi:MAG: hypothetical protein IPP13_25065 [Kouleothrix sp.]|jgi:hypothetical protein|nr:hypothetical protein [Kouleothrix sp.]
MNVNLTNEQLDLLISMVRPELAKKEQGFIKRWLGWGDKEEPTMAGLMKYAERFIRLHLSGLTNGSFSGEGESLEMTITFRPKKEKPTT